MQFGGAILQDMSMRQLLPDPATPEAVLQSSWGNLTAEIQKKTKETYTKYRQYQRRKLFLQRLLVLLVLGAVIGIIWHAKTYFISSTHLTILYVILLVGIPTWLWYMRDWQQTSVAFSRDLQAVLVPKLFDMMGLSGQWLRHSNSKKSINSLFSRVLKQWLPIPISKEEAMVQEMLQKSELITESYNQISVDDMYQVTYDNASVFFAELDVAFVRPGQKRSQTKQIFRGYFVSYDLARPLVGKTFISTEGDKQGFGHRSFWDSLTDTAALRETELEWNEFEELLHVATTNETEARYILTTNFMADLYDWWKDKPRNIRIAFLDQRLYLLFPDDQIRIEKTIKTLTTEQLQEYATTILRPMLHVLHLIDDVPLQR